MRIVYPDIVDMFSVLLFFVLFALGAYVVLSSPVRGTEAFTRDDGVYTYDVVMTKGRKRWRFRNLRIPFSSTKKHTALTVPIAVPSTRAQPRGKDVAMLVAHAWNYCENCKNEFIRLRIVKFRGYFEYLHYPLYTDSATGRKIKFVMATIDKYLDMYDRGFRWEVSETAGDSCYKPGTGWVC
jgi:hypothetical protein